MNDEEFIKHYGVLGMKWGHRKTVQELGYDRLLKSNTSNLNSWGKDPKHNILYITGYSGSGKSTIAESLKNSKTNVIHLDSFFEKMDKNTLSKLQDKEFIDYLKKNFPDYTEITHPVKYKGKFKEYWDNVDNFMNETEKFAEEQFKNKKKVIIEGVQLYDNTTYPNKDFFKDKPLIITGTGGITSFFRASERDEKSIFKSIPLAKKYVQAYINTHKSLDNLSNISNAKKSEKYVRSFMESYGDKTITQVRG